VRIGEHLRKTRNPKIPKTIYTVDRGEKKLTIGSGRLVESDFRISENGSSRYVDARTSDTQNPETPKGSAP
jgi:hypothetical protein